MPELYLLDLCNELDTGSKSENMRSGSLLKPKFLIIKQYFQSTLLFADFDIFSNVRHGEL